MEGARVVVLRTALALAGFLLLASGASAGSSADDGVRVSITLPSTTFLASEKPAATMTVVNPTAVQAEIVANDVVFQYRVDDGALQRSYPFNYSRVYHLRIAPGASLNVSLPLPSCD